MDSELIKELRMWASLIGTEPRGARELFTRAADALEASEAVRASVIAELRWLADAREKYQTDTFPSIAREVQTTRQLADILERETPVCEGGQGFGWIPSWMWDEWDEMAARRPVSPEPSAAICEKCGVPFHLIQHDEGCDAPESQTEPTDARHVEHVTVSWAYEANCLEGECEHVDEDGEPEDMSACPTVPPFEVCVDCMDASGVGRDPESWDDAPLIAWPCAALNTKEEDHG